MSEKILVIEDDPFMAEFLKTVLRREGFEVLICSDGVQSLGVVLREMPDVIILDLLLPGGSGQVVFERLQLSDKTKEIPIIVETAVKDEAVKKFMLNLGCAAYLEKPFESEQLLYFVNRALQRRRERAGQPS